MSYETVQAFVRVIDNHPEILSESETSQLEELIPVWLEEDELDEELGDWCAVRDHFSPKIVDTLSCIESKAFS